MATTLKGSVKGSYLPDIFQTICSGGTPGVFTFTHEANKVLVHIRTGGHIIHAVSTSRAVGLEAIEELAVWSDGAYHFDETADLPAPSIAKSTPQVLHGLASKIDEWKVLARVIPTVTLFPYPAVLPGEVVTFNTRERRIMDWANGHFTVEELAIAMGQPLAALAKTLYGLITKDRLTLKAVRYPNPPAISIKTAPAPVATSTAAPGQGVVPTPADGSAPQVDAGGNSGSVSDYLMFASRIFDVAKNDLPGEFGPEIEAAFGQTKSAILFDGGANLKTLKSFAVGLSKFANAKMAEGLCDRANIVAYNQDVQALFGLFNK